MNSVTVSDAAMFQSGDKIQIGTWPRWTRHIPTFRIAIRWAAWKFFHKRFGAEEYTAGIVYSQNDIGMIELK